MAERILVRCLNQKDDYVEWLLVNEAVPSEVHQGTLQDLAKYAENRPVILLLPASDVLLLAIDLPVKTSSQIKKALPFALDELLADDVETYHLVWHRPSKGTVYVAAINHDQFQTRLMRFQDAGIEVDAVYPESLCLPYQDQSYSILIDQQNAVLRYRQWLGGGIDIDALLPFVRKLLEENPDVQGLQFWDVDGSAQWLSELSVNKVQHKVDSLMQLLHTGFAELGEEFNLLTGHYSRKNTIEWQWQRWLPALGIILLAVLIQTGVFLTNYWQQKSELAALEAKNLALFKQTFPDVKRIVNMKAQADQQLIELKKQNVNNGSPFMRLLYQTGEMVTANPGYQLQQLNFVNGILQMQLTAPDISQVEQFKQQLERSEALSVKIQSAEAGQNAVEAHLEIREK
jgi:general secretion pathway protein L